MIFRLSLVSIMIIMKREPTPVSVAKLHCLGNIEFSIIANFVSNQSKAITSFIISQYSIEDLQINIFLFFSFSSETKYDSGSGMYIKMQNFWLKIWLSIIYFLGWPSYYATIKDSNGQESVDRKSDETFGMARVEVVCKKVSWWSILFYYPH